MGRKTAVLVPLGGLDWRKDLGVLGRLKQDRAWPSIEQRLSAGESPGAIARWCLAQGKVAGVKPKSLASKLKDHRDKVLRGGTKPGTPGRQAQQEDGAQPMLKDLDWLIRHQRARIRQGRKLEAQMKVPVAQCTRDIEALGRLMEIRANLGMELGLHKRAPVRVHSTHLGLLGMVQGLGVDGRERVRRAVGRVLQLALAEGNGTEEGDRALPGQGPTGDPPGDTDHVASDGARDVPDAPAGGPGEGGGEGARS